MAATKMLHIRIDDDIKTQADKTLAAMGLSMSEAVRLIRSLGQSRRKVLASRATELRSMESP